ncbi:MAG: OmpA family protein [Deltaproteobacteria bacterium]|nr:OmpA family protein [Deltaproteobacteria bacterium]
MRATLKALGCLAMVAHAAAASADEPGTFAAERLRPAMDREGLLDVEWGGLSEHLSYDAALWGSYALNPLVLYRRHEDGSLTRVGSLIGHRVGASAVGALSLFGWVKLGVEVPVVLYQGRGAPISPDDARLGALQAVGVGDLQLRAKVRLLRSEDHFVDLALMPTLTLPTGFPSRSYLGESSATLAPELVLSRAVGGARLAGNLGYRIRPDTSFAGLAVGQEIYYRAGVGFRFDEAASLPLEIDLTVNGATAALTPFKSLNQNPLELMGGVAYDVWGPLQLLGGAGVGLVAGYATPDLRLFAGVRFAPRRHDRDGDGIEDGDDRCPDEPEDRDGFEDGDGCPDPDNDGDGVLDAKDRCPVLAGVPEEQGCPAGDRDGDGVADRDDACPEEPGPVALQGCPDRDGDGVADRDDRCPDEPGVADNGGCPRPDIDKDRDGVPDSVDDCPDQPGLSMLRGCPDQDGDGIADRDDTCPEQAGPAMFKGCPDTDQDGIPDNLDRCVNDPETINGIDDEDGCPDHGPAQVTVTAEKIEIGDKVYFDTDKATIKARSFKLLDQVASILMAHPEIELVRIEGHTDSQASDDYNLKLSQQRADAVKDYLATKGVGVERLEAIGFGETKPVASNNTAAGREKNRRVEFHIVKLAGRQP